MQKRHSLLAPLLILAIGAEQTARSVPPNTKVVTVSRADLCVTEGAIAQLPDGRLSVTVPKMRAYLNPDTSQYLEARFTYSGSTEKDIPLGSGTMRRQFGIKLHAQDPCNLVYAMWRIEPESKIVVSVKNNPGQHTSAECGNHGYENVMPDRYTRVPVPGPGQTHALRAEMNGQRLQVFTDNSLAWDGNLSEEALSFHGPVGIRSDNARLEFELLAKLPEGPAAARFTCRSGPDESE